MRIGMGYDVHRLVEGRKLILCGVEIPYEKGLLGHSDADVALHAIMDALLGAAALGDIGKHFPDTDPAYEGASSMKLLKEVKKLLDEHCFVIENIDATIIAQRPKLLPYMEEMKKKCGISTWVDRRPCQYQGNDGRRTWIYRKRRGNLGAGSVSAAAADGCGGRLQDVYRHRLPGLRRLCAQRGRSVKCRKALFGACFYLDLNENKKD